MTALPQGILHPDTEVLIVDDSAQYATVLTKMLTHGFGLKKITHWLSSEDALTRLTENPNQYRLLFVDFRFPSGFTGGELLAELRKRGVLEGKVAFLITSEPTAENVKQAVQAGAFGIVAKPFDRAELKRQLEKAERFTAGEQAESF